jgi:NhaP-type Na+/H+ or K+/H+ antiporter
MLAIVAALVAAYALVARRLEALNITGPMLFLLAGLLANLPGFSLVELGPTSEVVRITTVVTLTLLLFADASTVDLRALGRDAAIPTRLLLVGLPLTVVLGVLVARGLMPGLAVGMAALLATVLAPTDLSLGLAMFANPRVPDRIRRSINVESGLNDGIAAPLVALATALVIAEFDQSSAPLIEAVRELGLGLVAGVAVGLVGGWLLALSRRAESSSSHSRQFAVTALAVAAYALALTVHGNGFIAAFSGGLAFGAIIKEDAVEVAEFTEQTGTLLSLIVWFMFGASLRPALEAAAGQWQPIAYAALSLTLIRMVPVALSLLGTKMHPPTHIFVGWFGPRGLASVVFLLQSLAVLMDAGYDTTMLAATASWTILGSVILHGASAAPVAAWYGKLAEQFAPGSPELEPSPVPQTRHGVASPSSARRPN